MKRILLSVIVVIGLMACTSASHAEPITLHLTHAFPSRDHLFLKPIADRFMKENPDIKIELEANATACLALLQQMLRDSVTGVLSDMVSSVCYTDIPILAEPGTLTPLGWVSFGAAFRRSTRCSTRLSPTSAARNRSREIAPPPPSSVDRLATPPTRSQGQSSCGLLQLRHL